MDDFLVFSAGMRIKYGPSYFPLWANLRLFNLVPESLCFTVPLDYLLVTFLGTALAGLIASRPATQS